MSRFSEAFSCVRRVQSRVMFAAALFSAFVTSFGLPLTVHAQLTQSVQNAQLTAQAAGIAQGGDLITIIGRIIYVFLSLLGVIFLLLLLYAGYLWMMARGNPDSIKKAQSIIRNAIIGLVIIASAWAITYFILSALTGTQDGGLGGGGSSKPPGGGLLGAQGSLGAGIIESHLPTRNATGVPRNTPVIITFKEPIRPDSFIEGWTDATSATARGLNAAAVKLYRTDAGPAAALAGNAARVTYTKDLKTYVIKPLSYLGSPTNNVGYTVDLKGGKAGILKQDGSPAFTGAFGGGYSWQFEVSTVVDLTPPYVMSAIPMQGGQYARNVIVQVNFNEAVDPTASTGKTADFTNLQVLAGLPGDQNPTPVQGEFTISNQYQTVEFTPDVKCGTNSCGRDIFCLPGNNAIAVHVKAASLDPQSSPPQAEFTNNGYNGVVDVAGNSLDGNKDGKGQGPPTDNMTWGFGTTNDIKLSPPKIETTSPVIQKGGSSNVALDAPVVASFDSLLRASTLKTDFAKIDAHGKDENKPDSFWWSVGMKLLTINGAEVDGKKNPPDIASKAAVVIMHRPYLPSGTGLDKLNYYDPYLLSGIEDVYQNCFNPAAACGTGTGNPNCCTNSPSNDPKGCKPLLNP